MVGEIVFGWHICGIFGMLLIQGSYVPQLLRTYKTKDVNGLSAGFISMIMIGCFFYLLYAISIHDPIYIASNTITILADITLLIMIYMYK